MQEIIKTYRSPNFGPRPEGAKIDGIIIHHTDLIDAQSAIDLLCARDSGVSCHYVIAKDGAIFQLVDDCNRAWHAGVSFWANQRNLNDTTIGIELDNPGYQYGPAPFDKPLMDSLIWLLGQLSKAYHINPHRILGHSDIAVGRKQDPSHLFEWSVLAKHGYGLWPKKTLKKHTNDILSIQNTLRKIGYDCPQNGILDEQTFITIKAFQLHFCPDDRAGDINPKFLKALQGFV